MRKRSSASIPLRAGTPITNLAELAAYAKAHPGEVTVGTTGIGSDDHIAMLKFERAADICGRAGCPFMACKSL